MRVVMQGGARESPAVDQRRVIQAVAVDGCLAPGQRGGEPGVRHVAGREHERALPARPRRDLFLERLVRGLVARDQVRGTRADAVLAGGVDEGFDDPRMRGEAEVVVAAEVHAGSAVEQDVRRVVRAAARGAPAPQQTARGKVRERRRERDRGDRHGAQPAAAAGSGRMPRRSNSP